MRLDKITTYVSLLMDRLFWSQGGEEILGPLGWPFQLGPRPEPWRTGSHASPGMRKAVAQIIHAAQIKDVAARVPEGPQGNELVRAAMGSIHDAIDQLCPPPRRIPWPRPPWGLEVVQELARVADHYGPGTVREELLNAAAEIAKRSLTETR